ncbi:hypothetical protein BDZ45DRAFT_694236 [Acephala macrosclerotiorum]|nr:hypothetical protein BDZ45DRAFT_694236 [Acephala macrosclerotiorum]
MVRSVGALVAQKFDKGSQHILRSKFYHERAKKSLLQALSQPSPILHTQSSLLLTMHAMHSESADTIDDYASKAMMHCALAGLYQEKVRRNQSYDQPRNQDEICESIIQRQVMRVCYGLDRLIAMAFDRPVSVADELIDTESLSRSRGDSIVFQGAHSPKSATATATGVAETDHRFLLRQIQSKIHTTVERLEYHSLCRGGALFPNMNLAVNEEEVRFVQIPDQKSCYTWTALVHQFQAGITLLYCFWATPPPLAHEVYRAPDIEVALLACAATLAEFSSRWDSARHFKAVFDLLNDEVVRKGRRVYNCAWRFHAELYHLVGELRKGRAHRRVLKLVEDMSGAIDQ